jgi:hypothetical protein
LLKVAHQRVPEQEGGVMTPNMFAVIGEMAALPFRVAERMVEVYEPHLNAWYEAAQEWRLDLLQTIARHTKAR